MSIQQTDRGKKKILQLGRGIIVYSSLIVYGFLSVTSFFMTAYFDMDYLETTYYKRDSVFLHFLITACFLFLLYWAERKEILERISEKRLCILLLCYAAAFSGIWSVISHSIPTGDQAKVIDCAADFVRGEYYYLSPGKYLQIYPQQLGYVAFLELLFHIFEPSSYTAIEIINICFICAEFYMLYKITGLVFENKKLTNLVLLLLFGFLPYLCFSTFIYGDLLGAPFALAAVYGYIRFVKEKKLSFGILAILCLGISVLMKQNNLIVVVAVSLYLLLKGLEQRKNGMSFGNLCFLMIVLSLLSVSVFDMAVKKQYEIRSGYEMEGGASPLMHIAMGMQEGEMAEGWYNGYILSSFWDCDEDFQKSADAAAQDIRDSFNNFISHPAYALKFYYRKIVSQWNNPTYECLWISHFEKVHDAPLSTIVQSIYEGKLHRIFLNFTNEYQWLLFAGAWIGMYSYRKKYTLEQLFLALIVLGGFFFHILWEAKSRYVLFYVILMVPYAAVGYRQLMIFLNMNWNKRKG